VIAVADNIASITKKRASSYQATRLNALKHGVLSQHTVLPWESEEEYHTLLDGFIDEFHPAGPTEEHLVEEIAGIVWRKRRLRLGEIAAHNRALDAAAHPAAVDETSRAALTQVAPNFKGNATAGAISSTDKQTEEEKAQLEEARASAIKALEILDDGNPEAYNRALAVVTRDILIEWFNYIQGQRQFPPPFGQKGSGSQDFKSFLSGEMLHINRNREIALEHRSVIRKQAFGETVDADRLEKLDRHEVHLDRKLERMLTMLMRLQELRHTKERD
jgi:hypothetical protein